MPETVQPQLSVDSTHPDRRFWLWFWFILLTLLAVWVVAVLINTRSEGATYTGSSAFGTSVQASPAFYISVSKPTFDSDGTARMQVTETNNGYYPFQMSNQSFADGNSVAAVSPTWVYKPLFPNRTVTFSLSFEHADPNKFWWVAFRRNNFATAMWQLGVDPAQAGQGAR